MRVYWIDEIIQYIEEKVVDYLLENSVRRQINEVERKFITKKYQKDLEEMVLKKYGREPFYDQLCQVLFKNMIIQIKIIHCVIVELRIGLKIIALEKES